MGIDSRLIDELLSGGHGVEAIAGENGLLKQLTKAILERALAAELTTHLGYEKHAAEGRGSGNSRNGTSRKRIKGDFGTLAIETPRDRAGSFEPQLLPKGQTRWHGFDDKILSLYARGMTTREIQGHLEEMYQVEVSPALISNDAGRGPGGKPGRVCGDWRNDGRAEGGSGPLDSHRSGDGRGEGVAVAAVGRGLRHRRSV